MVSLCKDIVRATPRAADPSEGEKGRGFMSSGNGVNKTPAE